MILSSSPFLCWCRCYIIAFFLIFTVDAATSTSKEKAPASASATSLSPPRRDRNLDHWDSDTLAAYLGIDPETGAPLKSDDRNDPYVGIDASVMFYAQWCKNCHSFAPVWDAIATLLKAGSVESNLILALFDCEADTKSARLCDAAGVSHYPTLLYIGSGDYPGRGGGITGKILSSSSTKKKKNVKNGLLPRTVKFVGNYALGDCVLDWVKAMGGISSWHRFKNSSLMGTTMTQPWKASMNTFKGILGLVTGGTAGGKAARDGVRKRAGNAAITNVDGSEPEQLPVGIPSNVLSLSRGGGGGGAVTATTGSTASTATTKKLETAQKSIETLQETNTAQKDANLHAGLIIEHLLFAGENGTLSTISDNSVTNTSNVDSTATETTTIADTDIFTHVSKVNAWDVTIDVLSSMETLFGNPEAIDTYRGKVVDKSCLVDLALDYCTRASTKITLDYLDELKGIDEYPQLFEMESLIKKRLEEMEPYCAIINQCYQNKFVYNVTDSTADGNKNADTASTTTTMTGGSDQCRPNICPFRNEMGCRYVSSCRTNIDIRGEYVIALQKISDEDKAKRIEGGEKVVGTGTGTGVKGKVEVKDENKSPDSPNKSKESTASNSKSGGPKGWGMK